jgi:phenylacetate-coenzyme A ligase PaaK-like adenylate-forming protein
MLATPELLQETAQPERLSEVISRSRTQIPLYAKSPAETLGSESGDIISNELGRWPFITKEDIRRGFPANFLRTELSLEELLDQEAIELEHTSGTSEERTPLLLPRGWWAEQELRALNLNAMVAESLRQNPEARRATINSPVCSGDIRYNGVPSRTDRILGNALFVSLSRYPFLWSERDLERIASEIVDWKPEFLDVDPVYGVVFALYCERQGIRLPSLRFIVCSYEFVSTTHRSILQRAFGVPVFDLYGSTETGHLLMEDTTSRMRPSLETAFLEVRDVDDSGIGSLVVTTLTNPFMPLIRYRIGDLVECTQTPYGKRYILHGRTADAFCISADKRVTTRQVDQFFAGLRGIAHYQLIQQGGAWILRFVPDGGGPESTQLAELGKRIAQLLRTSASVVLQETDILVPERSGKFRLGYPAKRG